MHGECDPAKTLPKVVCAADKSEAASFRDATSSGARLAQVLQNDVASEVHELKESESCSQALENVITGPAWWCIVLAQEEIH